MRCPSSSPSTCTTAAFSILIIDSALLLLRVTMLIDDARAYSSFAGGTAAFIQARTQLTISTAAETAAPAAAATTARRSTAVLPLHDAHLAFKAVAN